MIKPRMNIELTKFNNIIFRKKLKKEAVVEPKRACNFHSQSGIDLKLFTDALIARLDCLLIELKSSESSVCSHRFA